MISKVIVILFGVFLLFAGVLMLLRPDKARQMIGSAGSTNWINYGEITIRLIVAVAILFYADDSTYPEIFQIVGWFMLVTSIGLYCVPPRIHHAFSLKCASVLKPAYLQLLAPFAFLVGMLILYAAG